MLDNDDQYPFFHRIICSCSSALTAASTAFEMIYIRQERRRRHETLGWTGWNGHTLQDTAVLGGAALVSIFLSLGKLSLIPTPTNSYCLQRASIHCELSLDVHIARANEIGVDNKLRMQRNDALIKGHLNAAFYFCTNGKPASERCGTF